MIKASEAQERVVALLYEQVIVECEKIGEAIDKSAKSGAVCLVYGVDTQLYSRVVKVLREYGFMVSRYYEQSDYYDDDDDGKTSIEISWAIKDGE